MEHIAVRTCTVSGWWDIRSALYHKHTHTYIIAIYVCMYVDMEVVAKIQKPSVEFYHTVVGMSLMSS